MRLRTLTACAAVLLGVMLGGCHDWLTEVPEDFFSQDNFPASEADLRIALGGIDDWYTGGQSQAYFHRGWPMLTEVPSDQTVASATGTESRAQQDAFTLNPSNEWLWRGWRPRPYANRHADSLHPPPPPHTTGPPRRLKPPRPPTHR